MRWNGTVSHDGQMAIAARFTSRRATQAISSSPRRSWRRPCRGPRSPDRELIPLTSYRLDELVAELRPQPPHAHADDVRAGLELISPHRCEELNPGNRLAGMFHQLL